MKNIQEKNLVFLGLIILSAFTVFLLTSCEDEIPSSDLPNAEDGFFGATIDKLYMGIRNTMDGDKLSGDKEFKYVANYDLSSFVRELVPLSECGAGFQVTINEYSVMSLKLGMPNNDLLTNFSTTGLSVSPKDAYGCMWHSFI